MKTRIIVGSALVAMLALMLVLGGIMYRAVVMLFGFMALNELAAAYRRKGYQPIVLPAYVFAVASPALHAFFGAAAIAALYCTALLATMVWAVFSEKRTAADAIVSMSLFVYPLLFLITTLFVYFSFDRAIGLTAACFALAAPEFCDSMAYFGGTLFGKRKLCPSISPKKTVEGSVCATAGGVLFGFLMYLLQGVWGGAVSLFMLLPLGLGCGLLSQIGDLFASKIKRWADIKDFSSLFPGHGGVMDRIDSILLCTPFVLVVFLLLARTGA